MRAWIDLAGRRKHRERLAFEGLISNWVVAADVGGPLGALERVGDKGSYPALRAMLFRGGAILEGSVDRYADLAVGLGLQPDVAATIWDHLSDPGLMGFPPGPPKPPPPVLLRLLARVDGRSARTRSLLLSYLVTSPSEGVPSCDPALRDLLGEEGFASARAAVESEGGPLDLTWFAQVAGFLLPDEPASPPPSPPLPAEETLLRELDEAERRLRLEPSDSSLLAAVGRATLRLARKRLEAGEKADLLLSDAERFLAQAAAGNAGDPSLLLDRARTAYHLGKFEEEERFAVEALATLPPLPRNLFASLRTPGPGPSFCGLSFLESLAHARRLRAAASEDAAVLARPPERLEAFRWIGDAATRLLAPRSGGDAAEEARGMARGLRAFAWAALAGGNGPADWLSLASWFGALGRRCEEAALAASGLGRHPESSELHHAMGLAFRDKDRPVQAAWMASLVARNPPRSATCAWYLGLAHFIAAEWGRRSEAPEAAIATYRNAEGAFRKSVEMRPEFADSVNHYLAMAALGRGFAHLLAGRRKEAADCLVEGLSIRPAIEGVRDGLDREAVDLLDGALEWRENGPSPVDPVELAERLAKAAPADARWIRKVADTELREALRCDGRGIAAEGDRCLRLSVEIARSALAREESEESRRTLAQSATISAERLLRRGDPAAARPLLVEAAPLLGEEPPGDAAGSEALVALAARLREKLGAARPVARPGR